MKTKLNHIGMIKQSLGWLVVFAGAGLAVGALNYQELNHRIELGEQNKELTDAMVRAAHANAVLQQIGEGQAELTKKQLSSELVYDVSVIKALSVTAPVANQGFAQQVILQVAKNERQHPDYYVAATLLSRGDSGEVMQVVRH